MLYFILNGFLTLWIWKSEAGKVFVGVREGQQKVGQVSVLNFLLVLTRDTQLTLQSSVKRHAPTYRLKVRYEAPSGKKWEDKEIEGRFAEWFNDAGYLQLADLKKWLANNIEVIGMADPQYKKNVEERSPDELVQTAMEPPRSTGLETPSGAKGTRKAKRKA